MSRQLDNLIHEVKKTNKLYLTQDEIFALVLKVQGEANSTISSSGITLDKTTMTVAIGKKKLKVEKQMFNVLFYLMEREGKLVERAVMIRDLWGNDVCVVDRTLEVCVCKLRKIVGKDMIKTHKKVGYMFGEVK